MITYFEASISPGDIYKSLLQELINTVIPGGCPVDERNNKRQSDHSNEPLGRRSPKRSLGLVWYMFWNTLTTAYCLA